MSYSSIIPMFLVYIYIYIYIYMFWSIKSNQTQNPPTLVDIVVMFCLKVPSIDTIRLLA